MLVKKWMSTPVITVETTDTIGDANELLEEHRIRSLPVLEDGKLVGILTDRDLKKASIAEHSGLDNHELLYLNTRIGVEEFMTPDPLTVSPNATIGKVAKIMLREKISGIPVVDDTKGLVGMITQGDVFRMLTSFTGIEKKGLQIAIQIPDLSGSIKEIADILRNFGGRIGALLTSYEDAEDGQRNAYFKAYNLDLSKFEDLKSQLEKKGTLRYIINTPEDGTEGEIMLMAID